MIGASQDSLDAAAQGLSELLPGGDAGQAAAGGSGLKVAEQLYALADALSSSKQLCRALTDPSAAPESKRAIIDKLLDDRFDPQVAEFVRGLVGSRWSDDDDLPAALEQLGQQAVVADAQARGVLDQVESDLFAVADALQGSVDAREALSDADSDPLKRAAIVDKLLDGKVDPASELLARRATIALGGLRYGPRLDAMGEAIAKARGYRVAHVDSAVELTDAQTKRLEGILSRIYAEPIQVSVSIDPKVIGGLRIQVGPDVIDDTVVSRLADARRQMVGSGTSPE